LTSVVLAAVSVTTAVTTVSVSVATAVAVTTVSVTAAVPVLVDRAMVVARALPATDLCEFRRRQRLQPLLGQVQLLDVLNPHCTLPSPYGDVP
jgi:hypothetical protein